MRSKTALADLPSAATVVARAVIVCAPASRAVAPVCRPVPAIVSVIPPALPACDGFTPDDASGLPKDAMKASELSPPANACWKAPGVQGKPADELLLPATCVLPSASTASPLPPSFPLPPR